MAIFNSNVTNYQRVSLMFFHLFWDTPFEKSKLLVYQRVGELVLKCPWSPAGAMDMMSVNGLTAGAMDMMSVNGLKEKPCS